MEEAGRVNRLWSGKSARKSNPCSTDLPHWSWGLSAYWGHDIPLGVKILQGKRRLSFASAAVLRRRFGHRVVLVVVDEISMFQADQLVVLDERLRDIYGSSLPFGGKSVLLVRSFFSLPSNRLLFRLVIFATSCCQRYFAVQVSSVYEDDKTRVD
jgi:hypothetical protein